MKGQRGKHGFISKGDLLSKADLPKEWKKLVAWSGSLEPNKYLAISWVMAAGEQGLGVHDIANLIDKHVDYAEIIINEMVAEGWLKAEMPKNNQTNAIIRHNFKHKAFPPDVIITSTLVKNIRESNNERAIQSAKQKLKPKASPLDKIRKEPEKKKRVYKKVARTPTQREELNRWNSKPNPNRWRELDWVGYFLIKWKGYYGTENPIFIGAKFNKFRPKGRAVYDDPFWDAGILIVQCRDHDMGFRGQGQGMKEYIDWIFDDYLDTNQWMKTPITHVQMFKKSNNYFIPQFKMRTVKPKAKKRKWHAWGYEE